MSGQFLLYKFPLRVTRTFSNIDVVKSDLSISNYTLDKFEPNVFTDSQGHFHSLSESSTKLGVKIKLGVSIKF